MTYSIVPRGFFSLETQRGFFGGFNAEEADGSIVLAFPVETGGAAAVTMRQEPGGVVRGTVHGDGNPEAAWQQACAVLSLDIDGAGYPAVGERDPVLGRLQVEHNWLRPVLFHSPYEAACSFLIGHRITIVQGRAIRGRMAAAHGTAIDAAGTLVHAFPTPHQLLTIREFPGLSAEKVERLHGAARAALDAILDRDRLRSLPYDEAVSRVRGIRGLGDFFASGVVLRGAGIVDELPADAITPAGMRRFYDLDDLPGRPRMLEIAETWRPYRTWCSVLVHAAERRAQAAERTGERRGRRPG